MGTIAAPLLASVSIALIAVVLSSASAFRLVNPVLLLLVLAAAALIATVEFSFLARQYVVTPSEMEDWWPDHEAPLRRTALRREQRYHVAQFRSWTVRARRAYNTGILALSLGVALLVVPHGHISLGRAVVIIAAGLAFAAELAWVVKPLVYSSEPELPEVGPEVASGSGGGS